MRTMAVPTASEIQRRLLAAQDALQARLRSHYPTDPWDGTICDCVECDVTARQITVIHKVRTDRCCWCGTAHDCSWHSDMTVMDQDVVMAVLALADAIVTREAVK